MFDAMALSLGEIERRCLRSISCRTGLAPDIDRLVSILSRALGVSGDTKSRALESEVMTAVQNLLFHELVAVVKEPIRNRYVLKPTVKGSAVAKSVHRHDLIQDPGAIAAKRTREEGFHTPDMDALLRKALFLALRAEDTYVASPRCRELEEARYQFITTARRKGWTYREIRSVLPITQYQVNRALQRGAPRIEIEIVRE